MCNYSATTKTMHDVDRRRWWPWSLLECSPCSMVNLDYCAFFDPDVVYCSATVSSFHYPEEYHHVHIMEYRIYLP